MTRQHGFGRVFKLIGLADEVGTPSAFAFAGVAGQFDTVDGKHLPTDQALLVAQVEDLSEQRSDLAIEARDKPGNRCEVRGAVTAQGDCVMP